MIAKDLEFWKAEPIAMNFKLVFDCQAQCFGFVSLENSNYSFLIRRETLYFEVVIITAECYQIACTN